MEGKGEEHWAEVIQREHSNEGGKGQKVFRNGAYTDLMCVRVSIVRVQDHVGKVSCATL